MIEPLPKGKKFEPDTEECFPQFDHPEKKFFKLKADSRIKKLPESLYDAMSYFLLVNAIRDYRGETRTHRTMMIHVTRFTSIHEQIKDRVDEWLMKVRKALREPIPDNTIDTVDRLKRVFDKFELDKKVKISWDELLYECIPKAVSPITAGIQNALENDLHYDAHSAHGLRIIVVGGNSLSRGLTLEGLCVSYFYRNVTAYDTLMQMGRWFGYRPNYADLCKIWTTDKIAEWYGYITDTMQDLKDDLRMMRRQQRTPADFGVRIKLSPSVLSITAPNKMQNAKKYQISFSRQFVETNEIPLKALADNEQRIRDFIQSISNKYPHATNSRYPNAWSGVSSADIANLVREMDQTFTSFPTKEMSEHISR